MEGIFLFGLVAMNSGLVLVAPVQEKHTTHTTEGEPRPRFSCTTTPTFFQADVDILMWNVVGSQKQHDRTAYWGNIVRVEL